MNHDVKLEISEAKLEEQLLNPCQNYRQRSKEKNNT